MIIHSLHGFDESPPTAAISIKRVNIRVSVSPLLAESESNPVNPILDSHRDTRVYPLERETIVDSLDGVIVESPPLAAAISDPKRDIEGFTRTMGE